MRSLALLWMIANEANKKKVWNKYFPILAEIFIFTSPIGPFLHTLNYDFTTYANSQQLILNFLASVDTAITTEAQILLTAAWRSNSDFHITTELQT